jgi:hypothetical protein
MQSHDCVLAAATLAAVREPDENKNENKNENAEP